MGYRDFQDSEGTDWQAWDIVPRLSERRSEDRRQLRMPVATERRRRLERRVEECERSLLSGGMQGGWLCFECEREKRRLAPIPDDWLQCELPVLERYLLSAQPAPRVSQPDRRAG